MHTRPLRNNLFYIILSLALCETVVIFPQRSLAIDTGWESLTIPTQAGVISVRAIRINLTDAAMQIRSLTGVSGERIDVAGPVKSLKSFVDEVGWFAGINGSYFCPSDYAACAGKAGLFHWMWYDSVAGTYANPYQNQFNPGPVVAFDTQNRMHFFKNAENWPGQTAFESRNDTQLQALISNEPGLIYEGQLTVSPDQLDAKQRDTKSNRSGFGFKNNMLYLVVASSSTVMDLGYAMQAMGMQYAVNLDNGGSSALYYNGQYGVGPGRNMPNALVFADAGSQQMYTPPPVTAGSSFFAYDISVRGGFTVASGNVTDDARDEIITGTDAGLAPQIRVFDNQGNLKSQFFAYDSGLRNGVSVSACDIDSDGTDEIVTAQGRGGWPLVKIFDGYGGKINSGFYVLDGKFTGGVNLSCGDMDGGGPVR